MKKCFRFYLINDCQFNFFHISVLRFIFTWHCRPYYCRNWHCRKLTGSILILTGGFAGEIEKGHSGDFFSFLSVVFHFGSFPKHFVRFSTLSYRTDRIFANNGREVHSQLAHLLRASPGDVQKSLPGGKTYRRHAGLWWSNSVQSSQDCPQCLQSSL